MTLLALATLVATDAGRVGESGTGAMWIAPELVRVAAPAAMACSQPANLRAREIVFEIIEPGDSAPAALAAASREVVRFEWHPESGELVYDTAARTAVFSDVLPTHSAAIETTSCLSH